jgi:uncharacterized UPF0146 family protein
VGSPVGWEDARAAAARCGEKSEKSEKGLTMELLIDYLSRRYRRVVEVGIGTYSRVACALRDRGLIVIATDINPRAAGVPVVRDDLWEPRLEVYRDAQAIYAIRPPPEVLPPLKELARRLGADLVVKPLAGEPCDGQLVSTAGSFFYLYPAGRSGFPITPSLHHSGIPLIKESSVP